MTTMTDPRIAIDDLVRSRHALWRRLAKLRIEMEAVETALGDVETELARMVGDLAVAEVGRQSPRAENRQEVMAHDQRNQGEEKPIRGRRATTASPRTAQVRHDAGDDRVAVGLCVAVWRVQGD